MISESNFHFLNKNEQEKKLPDHFSDSCNQYAYITGRPKTKAGYPVFAQILGFFPVQPLLHIPKTLVSLPSPIDTAKKRQSNLVKNSQKGGGEKEIFPKFTCFFGGFPDQFLLLNLNLCAPRTHPRGQEWTFGLCTWTQ